MTTWAGVHVGDTVRGADQRVWTVIERGAGLTWLGSGVTDAQFQLQFGERTVTARRALHEAAPIVAQADHSAEAAAVDALIAAGFQPELLGETMTTATADPFTTPTAPVKRDRWGRYVLPDPVTGKERAWTRATTVARTLADEYNLTLWKLRQVAKGLALRPDLIAGAAAADPESDKKTLDDIAEKAMERAGSSSGATMGTALHAFAHRLGLGESMASLGVPAPLDKDLAAYVDTLSRHRLRILPALCERIVVLPELGVAGTFDNIVEQPSGVTKSEPLSLFDLKTAKSVDYSMLEIAIQLALYAHAPLMWNPGTQTYEPMPPVDMNRALVLHLPVGKAHGQIYGVNIIEGWEDAQLAMRVREARSRGKGMAWLVDPEPADLAMHRVVKAGSQADLAQLWEQLHPQGLWTEEVNAAATARMTELATATV